MRRLAHQIHVTVLIVLLPPDDAAADATDAAIAKMATLLSVEIGLWSGGGQLLTRTTPAVPSPDLELSLSGVVRRHGPGLAVALHLPDGRWLVALHTASRSHRAAVSLSVIALLAVAIGLGALPLSRRLTRRLERLRTGVENLGQGKLAARVEIEGRDEVADLARSFNRAAERIEHLVGAQRTVLAGASHELRSPLARLRVAVELMADGQRPDLGDQVASDIAELDSLIDEILLTSRLDLEALHETDARDDDVDMLALVAEEAARVGADVEGEPVLLRGSERLLRRLVRNLLENAVRHGEAASVVASVHLSTSRVQLTVSDRGPGIAGAERERVFEPYYRPPGAAESGRGYGLGLSLVRRIARLHGGEARCLDNPDGGCLFQVELPLPPDPTPEEP